MWTASVGNKLRDVKPSLGESPHANRVSRREEVVLARLRIGHTHLTHSHLLKGDPPPRCDHCADPLTIKHILVECQQLDQVRNRFYRTRSMKTLFEEINPQKLFQFLKEINVYNKL